MAENTKERILDAAFSLYRTPIFREVSLSEIAEKVGITKAAIFKHFKNKDDLFDKMNERMYADIAAVLGEMKTKYDNLQGEDAMPLVIEFCANHQEYLNYLIVSRPEFTNDDFFQHLKSRGVVLLGGIFSDDGTIRDLSGYFKSVFVSATVILFAEIYGAVSRDCAGKGLSVPDTPLFASRLSSLIVRGLGGEGAAVAHLRLAEIDGICAQSVQKLGELDRILLAIAKVISAEGYAKVTVDRIAKELGMAKSSLYTWFTNKNEMIKTLIHAEVGSLFALMSENMKIGTTGGERLYAFLQTELAYLISRPQLIDVCRWLQMSEDFGKAGEDDGHKEIADFFRSQDIFKSFPDIGLGDDSFNFSVAWFFVMPVFLLIHGRRHNFGLPILQAAMKDMYFMIQYGIDGVGV